MDLLSEQGLPPSTFASIAYSITGLKGSDCQFTGFGRESELAQLLHFRVWNLGEIFKFSTPLLNMSTRCRMLIYQSKTTPLFLFLQLEIKKGPPPLHGTHYNDNSTGTLSSYSKTNPVCCHQITCLTSELLCSLPSLASLAASRGRGLQDDRQHSKLSQWFSVRAWGLGGLAIKRQGVWIDFWQERGICSSCDLTVGTMALLYFRKQWKTQINDKQKVKHGSLLLISFWSKHSVRE